MKNHLYLILLLWLFALIEKCSNEILGAIEKKRYNNIGDIDHILSQLFKIALLLQIVESWSLNSLIAIIWLQ